MAEERPRLTVELGGGLSRASAPLSIRPGRARDLRNVYARIDELQARRGVTLGATLLDEDDDQCTHTICLHPQRSLRISIAVGYQQATGRVYVYRADALGGNPGLLQFENEAGDLQNYWFELAAGADPPSIIATDTYGKVFLAHDEEEIQLRAPTVYHDPEQAGLQLLMADLDLDDEEGPIKFRGVARHLDYLIGWGFGAETDSLGGGQDRPELVRASLPGEPTNFNAEHYWRAGQRGDPVLRVVPVGDVAVVFKAYELLQIFGYDRQSFGIVPLDPLTGLRGSQLACAVHHAVYFWSHEGPCVTDGRSPARHIDFELDLAGFEPNDLVEASEVHAFAAYIPTRKAVAFFFGQRVYTLCLEAEQHEWTYIELAQRAYCASVLYFDELIIPTGYIVIEADANWPTITDFRAEVKITHVGARSGHWVEVWIKAGLTAWQHWVSVPANLTSTNQIVPVSGLTPGTNYEIAMRYVAGTQYTEGYKGTPDTPDAWTAPTAPQSKETFTTPTTLRTLLSVEWERVDDVTEKVVLIWDGGPNDTTDILISADVYPPVYSTVDNELAGVEDYDYTPAGGEPETWRLFAVAANGGVQGPLSNQFRIWIGPIRPTGPAPYAYPQVGWSNSYIQDPYIEGEVIIDPDQAYLDIVWVNGYVGAVTEIWVDDGGGFALAQTTAANATATSILKPRNDTYTVKVRHKLTTGATIDYSDYTPNAPAVTIPEA